MTDVTNVDASLSLVSVARRLRAVARSRPWLGPFVALVVVYAAFAVLRPETFARPVNLVTMARQTVVVALASVGMTLVIVQGGIDLSVGSNVALTTVVVASRLASGAGPIDAVASGLAVATLCGLTIGALVAFVRIAPFIVTLGAMSIFRGAAKGIAREQRIDANPAGLDAWMAPLPAHRSWMLVPPGVWLAIAVAVVAAGALRHTRFGRHVFAVGSNERTARLCGVHVEATKLLVYTIAGVLAGLAGVMEFATLTQGDPTDSVGLELEVIAAVVIGGGSLSGGEGSILGALIGAFLMTVMKTGATHLGVSNWVQEIGTGVVIVAAIGLDRLRHRRERS